MYAPLARSDYYEDSVTIRCHQPTTNLPSAGPWAASDRFPRSPLSGCRVSRPGVTRQHRHAYAADLQHGLRTSALHQPRRRLRLLIGERALHPAQIRQIRAGGSVTRLRTLVPLVRLLVSLAGPVPAVPIRPVVVRAAYRAARLRDQAALSFTGLLRRTSGRVLTRSPGTASPRGAPAGTSPSGPAPDQRPAGR
jgi:hypothetical protein